MSYDNYFNGGLNRAGVDVPSHTQWRIKAESLLAANDIWTPTADKKFPLGAIAEARDGRLFRYCKNAAVALVKNVMVQGAVPDPQTLDVLQTGYTLTVGDKLFNLLATTGNSISNGDLIDGYMIINQGTSVIDEGDMYIIKDNKWITGDTVISIEIADQGGVRNAMAATANVTLFKNLYHSLIVQPTTVTGYVIGSTLTIVAADYYFWAQTKGVASVIIDTGDSIIIGDPLGTLSTGNGTIGSVGLVSTFATDVVFGICVYAAAGADYGLINFTNLE